MEVRQLGGSGLMVPVLTLGTGTFGGGGEFFKHWGASDVEGATRLVDICLDAGVTMFDSADVYSNGLAEEILGQAIAGRREKVLISTKATFRFSSEVNDVGSSRFHLIRAVDASLRRLRTDYIDLFQLHGSTRGRRSRKRWHTRSAGARREDPLHRRLELLRLAPDEVARRVGALRRPRYVAHQAYLAGRPRVRVGADAAGLDQKVGAVVWSPLGWARLTGKTAAGSRSKCRG